MIDQPIDTSSVSLSELEGMEKKSETSDTTGKSKTEDKDEDDDRYEQLNESAVEDGVGKIVAGDGSVN